MQRTLLFQGTATALVTPFKKDGSVDEHVLREFVDFQIKAGVEALVPVGSTGEGATLSESEQAFVIETVVDQTNGRVPVIGGRAAIPPTAPSRLAKQVKECRADGILTVAPFYNKPTQEGMYQHFGAIAEAVEMPVIIYNVPGRTASNIEPATALRLAAEIPFIAGIKEASGNLGQIMQIIDGRPEGFGVWSGDDNLTLPARRRGSRRHHLGRGERGAGRVFRNGAAGAEGKIHQGAGDALPAAAADEHQLHRIESRSRSKLRWR